MQAVIELTSVEPKKHSVRFNVVGESDLAKNIANTVYINRDAAKELLGVSDLASVKGVRVTVEVLN